MGITILWINCSQVRLEVNAYKNVSVHHEKIYDRIQRKLNGMNNVIKNFEDSTW